MAVVSNINRTAAAGAFFPTMVTLATSGDTLVYSQGSNQELVLFNSDVSAIICTIDGSAGTTVVVQGAGDTTVSVAAGYAISVPAGGFAVLLLDKVPNYCQGTVAISAATGAKVKAIILQ